MKKVKLQEEEERSEVEEVEATTTPMDAMLLEAKRKQLQRAR